MRFPTIELGSELIPLDVDPDHPVYMQILARWYATMWRAHPTVWEMHIRNGQFDTVNGRNGIPATKHCAAQALRAEVLAKVLGLNRALTYELVAGVLLTDSFKFREWQYMQRVGPSWDSYAEAQRQAKRSWQATQMFSDRVIRLASSVAHETLLSMEIFCDRFELGEQLTPFEIAQLIAHYADDISQDHRWVTEKREGRNVLEERILVRNASNPTYKRLNEEGRVRLHEEAVAAGYPQYFANHETTYEAQARVGRRVQMVLATLLGHALKQRLDPLDLPVIIDNAIRRKLNGDISNAMTYRECKAGA